MSLVIGDGGLLPIYPVQPSSGGGTPDDGDSAPSSTGGSSGSGGPDAVYEPSTSEDGEPLTYSFPNGASSSGGEEGEATDPESMGAAEDGAADPYVAEGGGEEPSYGDYGATDDATPDDGAVDPYAESGSEDYGPVEEPSGDPYADPGVSDGSEDPYDYGAYGEGAEEGAADPYAGQPADGGEEAYGDYGDGAVEDGAADPYAAVGQDDGVVPDTSEASDVAEAAPAPAQPAVISAFDHISRAAQRDSAQKEAAAAVAARPSLSAAMGRSQEHVSLAAQMGKTFGASDAVVPASSEPIIVPARFAQVTQVAATKVGPLLSPAQDPAASVQPEAPKAKAAVMAQAAYGMVGEAQRMDRSILSLIKFG